MTTIRVHHVKDYVVIANRAVQDGSVTLAARGLHHLLLSFPDDWEINVKHLVRTNPEGRDKIYKLIAELVSHRYMERNNARSSEGRFGGSDYLVHELPLPENTDTDSPLPDLPDTVLPDTDPPDTVLPDTYKVLTQQSTEVKKVLIPKSEKIESQSEKAGGGKQESSNWQDPNPETETSKESQGIGEGQGSAASQSVNPTAKCKVSGDLGALRGGTSREYQRALADQAALTLFESKKEEDDFFEWASSRLGNDGARQADFMVKGLRNEVKATPRDKNLLTQFRNCSNSASQQAQEKSLDPVLAKVGVLFSKDPVEAHRYASERFVWNKFLKEKDRYVS